MALSCYEPKVVHIDQEFDYKITELAPDFETFIEILQNEDKYDSNADDAD